MGSPVVLGVLVAVAPWPSADGASAAVTLRGQTDENQPMLLRLVRSQRLVGFRIQYDVLNCRGPGSGGPSGRVAMLRAPRPLKYDRRGRLNTRYSTHRFMRSFERDLLTYEAHIGSRVMFRSALGRHRSAFGSFRVVTRVYGRVIGEAGYERVRYGCDSGTHRWRVPRFDFSGPWRPTGPLLHRRSFAALVALRDGRVLLAGGSGVGPGTVRAAEAYEPRRNRWTRAGTMLQGRDFAGAARLADGRVLIAGGYNAGVGLRSAEVYSPTSNRWSAAQPMVLRRIQTSAVLLDDGRAFVTGGNPAYQWMTAELYDAATDSWARVADSPLPGNRSAVAGPLPMGRVIVVVADDFERHGLSSVYDPASNAWTDPEAAPGVGRDNAWHFASLTLLRDGRVLLVGDCIRGMRATALYGPAGWSTGPAGPPCGYSTATAMLPSGRVLLAGYPRAAFYDPAQNRWTAAPRYFFAPNAFAERDYMAPVPGGALIVGDHLGLNRFSASERFFER
jgi:hypothetical protein